MSCQPALNGQDDSMLPFILAVTVWLGSQQIVPALAHVLLQCDSAICIVCWRLHLLWRYREVRRCEQQPQGPTPNGTSGVSCRVRDQLVEQELIYEKLPKDIANRHVLLMDPILATGNSAAKAIQAS